MPTSDIDWGPELLGFYVQINQSADLGVKDERDAAMRELFRDLRFRRALSHATDRDGMAQATMRGPFLRAWAGWPDAGYRRSLSGSRWSTTLMRRMRPRRCWPTWVLRTQMAMAS